jgi:hypothetical protein
VFQGWRSEASGVTRENRRGQKVSEDTGAYMVAPTTDRRPALPKRTGPKGLRSTWLNRGLRVEYVSASGLAVEASGIQLDTYPVGPVPSLGGTKTLLYRDSLRLLELVED